MASYRALTWNHPRGFNALAAAGKQLSDNLTIVWEKQPLEGFEEHAIDELCARYDLVVLDHPHIGEAVAKGCLKSLDDIFDRTTLEYIAENSVGQSFRSYAYAGRQWALPLDAATQISVSRPDLLDSEHPDTWEAVLAVARKQPIALTLAGPHAALNLFSITLSLGGELASAERMLPQAEAEAAFTMMAELYASTDPALIGLNPIGVLEQMALTDDIVLCPLVYGYVNYTRKAPGKQPLHFGEAPKALNGRGSILGGTGIAISKRCTVTLELIDHLLWLMSSGTQVSFIPAHDGQPSNRAAWLDDGVNARWGNFYRNTMETIETAHVRPRGDGYVAFQKKAAAIVRNALVQGENAKTAISAIEAEYQAMRLSEKEK